MKVIFCKESNHGLHSTTENLKLATPMPLHVKELVWILKSSHKKQEDVLTLHLAAIRQYKNFWNFKLIENTS